MKPDKLLTALAIMAGVTALSACAGPIAPASPLHLAQVEANKADRGRDSLNQPSMGATGRPFQQQTPTQPVNRPH